MSLIGTDKKCIKCQSPASFMPAQSTTDPFCRPCYEECVKKKFRSALGGKNKVFRNGKNPNDNPVKFLVLVEWDARAKILLQLINEVMNQTDPQKHFQLTPKVYVVDTSRNNDGISGPTNFEGFKINNIHLSYLLNESNGKSFQKLLDALPSKPIRLEFKRLMFDLLAWRLAEQLHLNIVMTAENAEILAQKSMETFWFGRSTSVCELANILDNRHPTIKIVRPLRNIHNVEIDFLNGPDHVTEFSNFSDIASYDYLKVADKNGFPSILTNVLSVSSKLTTHSTQKLENLSLEDKRCSLCQKKCSEKICELCKRLFDQIDEDKRKIVLDILFLDSD